MENMPPKIKSKVAKRATPLMNCDATIAICTYNRRDNLVRTLASLRSLRGKYKFTVIVVNGPSTDGTTEILSTYDDILTLNNEHINLSISRNIALANTYTRYIAFIDDDAIPEFDWLSLLIERMDSNPHLAAVGGFIRDADGIKFQAQYVYADVFGIGVNCESKEYISLRKGSERTYLSTTGTNVLFRTSILRDIYGFDELFSYFLDETDVNKRLDDLGHEMDVVPQAEIHHKYAPSHLRTENKTSKNMYPIARSVTYFSIRHGQPALGWESTEKRISQFYADEFRWKAETLFSNGIDRYQFETLMNQTAQGIFDGIEAAFQPVGNNEFRVSKHTVVPRPRIRSRAMRPPESTLRLCMLSRDHAHSKMGGIGRWTNLVARGLAERGHEVTVIGETESDKQQEYCDFGRYNFWSHSVSHFGCSDFSDAGCLGLPTQLANASKRKLAEFRRILDRRRFHVVSSPIWDVEGAALIETRMSPNVLSLHTCTGLMLTWKPEWKEDENYFNNHVLKVMSAEIQAIKKSELVLANSEAIVRDVAEVYELDFADIKHSIVPHGIEDIHNADEHLTERSARTNRVARPLRILFLGRLETRKGVAHLVPVLRELLLRNHSIVVDLVGERVDDFNFSLVQRLLDEFPQSVFWHGFLTDSAIDDLMRQADIFFAPSTYESFGLIFVEAMRYSLPCVAFATGGVPEVVTNGVDGLLAAPFDQAELFRNLELLSVDTALRIRLSSAARRSFVEKFTYELMACRLESVYRDAAGSLASD